jgi:hypothetical protein
MAAQIPIKNNPSANTAAMEKVKADKHREVKAGHDGTWVAHPDLAHIAVDIFNAGMTTPNQLFVRREDVHVRAQDLLNTSIPGGKVTEKGIKENIEVGLIYCEAWLRGIGCSPINNLMEDAATAEISVASPKSPNFNPNTSVSRRRLFPSPAVRCFSSYVNGINGSVLRCINMQDTTSPLPRELKSQAASNSNGSAK